jgi:hypothetical protein
MQGLRNPVNLLRLQSALDEVEEHLQPFLEAGPKDITAQVCTQQQRYFHICFTFSEACSSRWTSSMSASVCCLMSASVCCRTAG